MDEIPKGEEDIKAYCYACLDIVDRREPHYCIAETLEKLLPNGETEVIGEAREIGVKHLRCKLTQDGSE